MITLSLFSFNYFPLTSRVNLLLKISSNQSFHLKAVFLLPHLRFTSNLSNSTFAHPQPSLNKNYLSNNILFIDGKKYEIDNCYNLTLKLLQLSNSKLYLKLDHPLYILKHKLYDIFKDFKKFDNFGLVINTKKAFDDLLIPQVHSIRSERETFYVNKEHVLKPHATSNELDVFDIISSTQKKKDGEFSKFVILTECFRRDKIDKTHYPIFHQFETVSLFDVNQDININDKNYNKQFEAIKEQRVLRVDIANLQKAHKAKIGLVELVTKDLEYEINTALTKLLNNNIDRKELEFRWVEAQFPFTQPSWEIEVKYKGKWIELCGCGILKQEILVNCGITNKIGWACGLGMDRLAMALFGIEDIRWLWTKDERFFTHFKNWKNKSIQELQFKPFSKYNACYKDISFYLLDHNTIDDDIKKKKFDYIEMCALIREVDTDFIENVSLIDEFTNKDGIQSKCYRITYRAMNRNVTNDEINKIQNRIELLLQNQFSIKIR